MIAAIVTARHSSSQQHAFPRFGDSAGRRKVTVTNHMHVYNLAQYGRTSGRAEYDIHTGTGTCLQLVPDNGSWRPGVGGRELNGVALKCTAAPSLTPTPTPTPAPAREGL